MFITVQVADANAEFERLIRDGFSVPFPLRDEPWGQRRFGLYDPSGTWVDVVQQIAPAPGFWDTYLTYEAAVGLLHSRFIGLDAAGPPMRARIMSHTMSYVHACNTLLFPAVDILGQSGLRRRRTHSGDGILLRP